MAPNPNPAPTYISPIEGPIVAGGDLGVTMEDKFKGVTLSFDPAYQPDVTTYSNVTATNDSYSMPKDTPPDRGYYARTFGGRRRRK